MILEKEAGADDCGTGAGDQGKAGAGSGEEGDPGGETGAGDPGRVGAAELLPGRAIKKPPCGGHASGCQIAIR